MILSSSYDKLLFYKNKACQKRILSGPNNKELDNISILNLINV